MTNEERELKFWNQIQQAFAEFKKEFDERTKRMLASPSTNAIKAHDPVAEKLWGQTIEEDVPNATVNHRGNTLNEGLLDTLQHRNARAAQEHPLAFYETIEFVHSDDDVVVNFIEALGINTDMVEEAEIVIRPGEPLRIKATLIPIWNKQVGSIWSATKGSTKDA